MYHMSEKDYTGSQRDIHYDQQDAGYEHGPSYRFSECPDAEQYSRQTKTHAENDIQTSGNIHFLLKQGNCFQGERLYIRTNNHS